MTKRYIAIPVALLFTLNAAALVWMRLLPEESFVLKGVFPDDFDGADMNAGVTAKGTIKDMAGAHYVWLYRKYTTANTVASVVLFLNACFLLAVGMVLSGKGQTKEAETTEQPAASNAEDLAPEP